MEMEFVTEEASDDEFYGVDDNTEDYLNFEGERCGICTDVVIDRGVIDCCQHWFCFACIDNWATITSLCPLCQNEFQLITCVPVYDTVGGNKTDEDTSLRDDDWFVEGKTNTLSFPSYYIDENAVVCLDGDGCKIRSGSVAIEEDSDVDTSIACDSCDKWYHAFCVGFDPEVTCDSSWLCPRCSSNEGPKKTDGVSVFRKSDQNDLEIAGGDCLAEVAFSGEVSVSVVDDGETAVIMSLVEGSDNKEESSAAVLGCSKDMDKTLLSSSLSNLTNSESLPGDIDKVEQNSGQQENALYFSQDVRDASVDGPESMGPTSKSEEYLLPVDSADNKVPNKMEVLSFESMNLDEKETAIGIAGAKRKHTDSRKVADGEAEATLEGKFSRKKIKDERNTKLVSQRDQTVASVSRQNNLRDTKIKSSSENENGSSDIMDIVRGTDRRSLNQLGQKNSSGINPKERETASGLRLKKIMRQAGDDKDSSALQELRKKIREAVRNKSSNDSGQNLFDQKLLDAFRASLAASGDETRKPTLDVKAKKSLLQKGKVRESLTKKIYGTGGKRRRAWTRECEVEFWKHRCIKTSKPEKIQALKSVLDVLKDNSDQTKRTPENEEEAKGSILSRLYLADASVFPKKDDVKPVSALQADPNCEQKNDNDLSKKVSTSLSIDQSDKNAQKQNLLDGNEMKKSVNGMKSGTASGNARQKGCPKGASTPSSSATKDMVGKSDDIKSDKRKWALELLARKTAVSGKTMQEKEEDTTILKGNYTLLAQLQKDMRPVLAPSRHNKIPTSVRQAQLYRLTEHFLKKANLSTVCRTAETELAVADAVNIEKQVADRSNSKLVYVNLCSQELLRRSDDVKSDKAQEAHPSSTTEGPSETEFEETKDCSSDLAVDEALRKAGLMSDSPPNSPKHEIEEMNDKVGSPEVTAEGQTDNVIEIDSNPELDIYGDFEYSLEDDDFISASAFNVAKPQPEPPKIKMVFSSLQPEKPNVALADVEALNGSFESLNKTTTGGSTVDGIMRDSTVQNSSVGNDEELDPDECEVLYGPDKEPIIVKFPETLSITPVGPTVQNDLPGEKERDSGQPSEDQMGKSDDGSTPSTSNVPENKNVSKQKTTKCDKKQTEQCNMVTKKVEAYIKEHIRPLCKSGVITVEQYRWAVGKTSEKVMKYHSKEKNANFLIKEGEKVKKLAEQYVETAQQQAKN